MSSELVVERYRRSLDEEADKVVRFIVSGKCKSFEEYQARCHEIYAYQRALENFNDAIKSVYEEIGEDQEVR